MSHNILLSSLKNGDQNTRVGGSTSRRVSSLMSDARPGRLNGWAQPRLSTRAYGLSITQPYFLLGGSSLQKQVFLMNKAEVAQPWKSHGAISVLSLGQCSDNPLAPQDSKKRATDPPLIRRSVNICSHVVKHSVSSVSHGLVYQQLQFELSLIYMYVCRISTINSCNFTFRLSDSE